MGMTNEVIILTKGTSREYITVGSDGDEIRDAHQIVDLSNNTSTLEFQLEMASRKWDFFEGFGLEAESWGRLYCIIGDDCISRSRDLSGTHLPVKLKETWYKLAKKTITAYNINVATSSEFDHIDQHMVVLLGNSPDPLYVNGTRVTNPYTVGTSQYLFYSVLYGTGWTMDTRYASYWPDGKHDLETDKVNVLDNIKKLQELFGGLLFWDSKNMRVALVDENKYQVYNGYEARYGKNLVGIERKDNTDVTTRLYIYGNSNLNIAAVNGGKEYIDNFTYTTEILEGIASHNDIYTQSFLLDWGRKQSEFMAKPRRTYSIDVLKHESEINKTYPQPELGLLAKVIDQDIVGPPVLQRILKTDQNVFVTRDLKIVAGDIIKTFEGVLRDIGDDSAKAGDTISGTGQIPGSVVRGSTPALDKANLYWESVIKDTENKLQTSITQTASQIRLEAKDMEKGLNASITLTASQIRTEVNDIEKGLNSSITQTAKDIRLEVSGSVKELNGAITEAKSSIKIEANRISLVVEGTGSSARIRPAEIVASINSSGSSVLLSADKIQISGTTTFKSWIRTGTTKIDGGSIYTDNMVVTENAIFRGNIEWGDYGRYGSITQPNVGTTLIKTNDRIVITASNGTVINAGVDGLKVDRKITCGHASTSVGLSVTGVVEADRYDYGTSSSGRGATGSFKDQGGNTITVKGGIITDI